MKKLFKERIDKDYSLDLYVKQFSLYIDNIVARIDLQVQAYNKEKNIPAKLFELLNKQKEGLLALKQAYGPIVTPEQIEGNQN